MDASPNGFLTSNKTFRRLLGPAEMASQMEEHPKPNGNSMATATTTSTLFGNDQRPNKKARASAFSWLQMRAVQGATRTISHHNN